MKQVIEKELYDNARKKFPLLFKIFDERQSLRFKNPSWVKAQAIKKGTSNKAHLFKNLKQILTNFDGNQ